MVTLKWKEFQTVLNVMKAMQKVWEDLEIKDGKIASVPESGIVGVYYELPTNFSLSISNIKLFLSLFSMMKKIDPESDVNILYNGTPDIEEDSEDITEYTIVVTEIDSERRIRKPTMLLSNSMDYRTILDKYKMSLVLKGKINLDTFINDASVSLTKLKNEMFNIDFTKDTPRFIFYAFEGDYELIEPLKDVNVANTKLLKKLKDVGLSIRCEVIYPLSVLKNVKGLEDVDVEIYTDSKAEKTIVLFSGNLPIEDDEDRKFTVFTVGTVSE